MRIRTVLASCFFLLIGCEVSVATVNLSEPAISEQIDPISMAPVTPAETFLSSTGDLNATIKLSDASTDIAVTALFYMLGAEQTEIARQTTTTSGTGYLNFSLSPPPSGWPLGNYQVDYYLGEELRESLSFSIELEAAPALEPVKSIPVEEPTAAAGAQAAMPAYRVFEDAQFGFGFELPDNWDFKVVGERNDYLFRGPEGSAEGQILIIVQMMDTRKGTPTTLKAEMLNLLNQFEQMEGVEILKKDEFQVNEVATPFFITTYPSENQQGEAVSWGQTQLGLENGPVVLLLSYSAPRTIYQQKIDIFQHMMESFVLSPPE